MRIILKDNPKPSFCNHSVVTIVLSEPEFEDVRVAIDICCEGLTPSREFVDRLKAKYLPKLIAATEKIDEKYNIS